MRFRLRLSFGEAGCPDLAFCGEHLVGCQNSVHTRGSTRFAGRTEVLTPHRCEKFAFDLQVADFSQLAPNFGTPQAPVVDYYCSRRLALVRGIDRRHPTWTIRAARINHNLSHPYTLIGRVAIGTAWFGGNNPLSHHP
jgi:hypothetical protein